MCASSITRWLIGLALLTLHLSCTPSNPPDDGSKNAAQTSSGDPTKNLTGDTRPTKGTDDRKASSFRALKLLEGNRFDEAWDECQKVLFLTPKDSRALYVAANVLNQRKKLEQALQMIDRIPIEDPEYGLMAHRDAVTWTYASAMLLQAETRAKEILRLHPKDLETVKNLAAILDLQGRRFESSLLGRQLVTLGRTDLNSLVLAADTVKPVNSDAVVNKLLESHPQAIELKSSSAFAALFEKRPEDAVALFQTLIQSPNAPAAYYAGLGIAWTEQEKFEEIPSWLAAAPVPSLESLPSYWRVIGTWFLRAERYDEAAYCFTRAVELDPLDYLSYGPLAQSLLARGDTDKAHEAELLFQQMQLTNRNINYCRDGFRKREWMLQIAETLEKVGRLIESLAWKELCEQSNDGDKDRIQAWQNQRKSLSSQADQVGLRSPLSWAAADLAKPSLETILSTTESTSIANSPKTIPSAVGMTAKLQWTDVAPELGIRFQYDNGDDPNTIGMQTYQSNGAGAGAIDFDRDGWCDLYALQGGSDPRTPAKCKPSVLFRNLQGNAFVDVARKAYVTNDAYGQGAAVGDWDQDGFADMLVLNFGQNRLLRNMGDGTFEEITVPSMVRNIAEAPVWSVSGAIADVDGDHLPDLVEVNYSSGIDVITHLCVSQQKVPQVCRPTEFPASQDFIYLNQGDGSFVLANDLWQMELNEGRGLGVVVGNLDGTFGNDIYIANDMSPNNLLISAQDPKHSERWLLSDEAVRRGCAVDIHGKPQASMGVGCADVDRNGTLDLFMTNFIDEYNALYVQSPSHFYTDASRRYRLIDPKKKTLGFGTQLIDVDLDGWQDVVIVNGHVDDYRSNGQPYQMRPQVLLQRDGGFVEQPHAQLGKFFERETLSRSLGIWDFDNDGRPDWYVTHLDAELSILHNECESRGTWVSLELVGTTSERDAIGAEIRVKSGNDQWIHQRMAGNGFECSNAPWIFLGLGDTSTIESLEIEWPSGQVQRFENLPTNHRFLVIESQPIERID